MKLGIVFEGGASRTYFSTGVMDLLLEEKIYADYVIGVSAGIANGVSYVSRQLGRNIEIGEKYVPDKRYMGLKHLLNPAKRSYYNTDFVFGEIPEKLVPFDFDAFSASGCEAVAVVTNIGTGKPEYMRVNAENPWKVLIASCSLPILFPPVEIDGQLYMDGGLSDSVPVDKAIEDGCDKIIVVTTREKSYRKTKESGTGLASLIYRKYPKLVNLLKIRADEYNESHDRLLTLEEQGRIFIISPENTEGWGRTDNDPVKIRSIHNSGYDTARQLLPEILKYINR